MKQTNDYTIRQFLGPDVLPPGVTDGDMDTAIKEKCEAIKRFLFIAGNGPFPAPFAPLTFPQRIRRLFRI